MHHTREEWLARFARADAYWKHSGNPMAPHALLTSGKHSTGFFAWQMFLKADPEGAQKAVEDLYEVVRPYAVYPEVILGPQTGARWLSEALAANGLFRAEWSSPVKVEDTVGKKRFVFEGDDFGVHPRGKSVLLSEDTITTGGSVESADEAAIAAGASNVADIVICIFNRSGLNTVGNKRIVALVTEHLPTWAGNDDWPDWLDKSSVALRPKHGNNWELLRRGYI